PAGLVGQRQNAAGGQERIGEKRGVARLVKRRTRGGQRADDGIAVALDEESRRAPRRMVSGPFFLLQYDAGLLAGNLGGDTGAGNAAPNNRHIDSYLIGHDLSPHSR